MSTSGIVCASEVAEYEEAGTLPVVPLYAPLLPTLLDPGMLIRERQGKLLWLNRVYIDATPSKGLIGSAPDVADLMMAYLNRGPLDGNLVMNTDSVSKLTETKPIEGYGLGWWVGESDGERYLEHMGGGPGFATTMRLYPDLGLGIVILANGTDLERSGLADFLVSINR